MRPRNVVVAVAVAALLIALPWLLPPFYANLLCFIAIYGGVATGLTLLTGYAGLVSLGQGAFYGIGAYGAVVLAGTYGVDPWLAATGADPPRNTRGLLGRTDVTDRARATRTSHRT